MEINKDELGYLVGCALTGLLANPNFGTTERQHYLRQKNLTTEKLAVSSALATAEYLALIRESLDNAEATASLATEAVAKMVAVPDENKGA